MNDPKPTRTTGHGGREWGWLVVGIVLFAILMALRVEIQSSWLRAGVAGLAAAALMFGIIRFKQRKG
jgi:hypothetical protein